MDKDNIHDFFKNFKASEASVNVPDFDELYDERSEDLKVKIPEENIYPDPVLNKRIHELPRNEKVHRDNHSRYWLAGIAAVISVIFIFKVVSSEKKVLDDIGLILDTGNSPTVTNALTEPEEENLLDWEAPSDYLTDDFN